MIVAWLNARRDRGVRSSFRPVEIATDDEKCQILFFYLGKINRLVCTMCGAIYPKSQFSCEFAVSLNSPKGFIPHVQTVKKEQPKSKPEDYKPYVDPLGVTHWLPPKRCKTCED
jgi:hypothetical protein